ncbi:MAG: DUF111 family protein [Actinobacteria bacterium]|jgi:uncharacterized protein (DUF111 family)|nr:MAG: DUF111 family protein [Actinomycetota bacterium]
MGIKPGRLLLAQVDDVSGEIIGFFINRVLDKGARNVHVIPTLTKKNRPGYILLVDIEPASEESIGAFMARELGVSGYHILETEHAYSRVSFVTTTIEFRHSGRAFYHDCLLKLIGPADKPLHVKVEYEELVSARKAVEREFGLDLVLDDLKKQIERGFASDHIRIEV